MAILDIQLLGVPQISLQAAPLRSHSRVATALLAYLAVTGQPHSRDTLATLFWPDQDQSTARAYLRNTLWQLNRAGLEPWLSSAQDVLSLENEFELDVKQLQAAAQFPLRHPHAPGEPCTHCIEHLNRAVAIYRGDFMAGFNLPDCPEFDKWQTLQAEHLRMVFTGILEQLTGHLAAAGETEQAIEIARRRVNLDPLDEPAQRELMRLLAACGQRSQALKQYETLTRVLDEELGVEPEAESQKLNQDILHHRYPPPVTQPASTGTPAGASEERQGAVLRRFRHSLPAQLTSFIGRKKDLRQVRALLASIPSGSPPARLVTLTGPGGSGKTRLALQTAAELAKDFEDGVYFVGLAHISQPENVPTAIARTLEIDEIPDRPVIETLKENLHERQTLLVLDNFEHLVGASPVISDLLSSAPNLSVLVTSREVLHLYGEQIYEVPPLELPRQTLPAAPGNLADLLQNESIQLFLQRARSVQPEFEITPENYSLVAEICIRLDGLPLAIELAAARTGLLSLDQLLVQLSDRFKILRGGPRDAHIRQQTLRGAIDWSYNLLMPEEQRLLNRMSVFQGKSTLEAVEAVCSVDVTLDVQEGLESLLGKSLLRRDIGPASETRFMMLETIREYAAEKLHQAGETEALRQRHAAYYLELAETSEPFSRAGPRQIEWLRKLEAEHNDLRRALSWALDGGSVELGLRMAGALFWFWNRHHHFTDWGYWSQRALDLSAGAKPEVRAMLLLGAGLRTYFTQQPQTGTAYLRQALDLYRQIEDRVHLAWTLLILGINLGFSDPDRYDEAVGLGEEGLALCRELDDQGSIAQALNVMGELVRSHGDYERAAVYYEESLALARQIGDQLREHMICMNLGYVAYHAADFQKAAALFKEGIDLARRLDLKPEMVINLGFLAGAIGQQGQNHRAAQIMAISEKLSDEVGVVHQPADQTEYDQYKQTVRSQLGETAFQQAWQEGLALAERGLEWAVAFALDDKESPPNLQS